ncbi:hypothetical protein BD560DRAFT_49114 [Blakeslea trispora]|nr:hypothetical protein BD560DRAFT_49114 [Blakeslea trispora]
MSSLPTLFERDDSSSQATKASQLNNSKDTYNISISSTSPNHKYVAYISTKMSVSGYKLENDTGSGSNLEAAYCSNAEHKLSIHCRYKSKWDSKDWKITDLFPDDWRNYTYFLSISNDGKYVCISSFHQCVANKYCIIYEIKNEKIIKLERLCGLTKIGGYGAFLNDGRFVIINMQFLQVYSENFSFLNCYRIAPLLKRVDHEEDLLSNCGILWNGKLEHYVNHEAFGMLRKFCYMVQKIQYGYLMGNNSQKLFQVYLIQDYINCITVGDEEVQAMSRSLSLYAVYNNRKRWLIFNSSDNTIAHDLSSRRAKDNNSSYVFAKFSDCERYFVCSSLLFQDDQEHSNIVCFEVWDLISNRTIYFEKEELKSSLPKIYWCYGLPIPCVVIRKQDQDYHSRPSMEAFYWDANLSYKFLLEEKEAQRQRKFFKRGSCKMDKKEDGSIHWRFDIQDHSYCVIYRHNMLELWKKQLESDPKLIFVKALRPSLRIVPYRFLMNNGLDDNLILRLQYSPYFAESKSETPSISTTESVKILAKPRSEPPVEVRVEQPAEVRVEQPVEVRVHPPVEVQVERPIEHPIELQEEQPVELPLKRVVELGKKRPGELSRQSTKESILTIAMSTVLKTTKQKISTMFYENFSMPRRAKPEDPTMMNTIEEEKRTKQKIRVIKKEPALSNLKAAVTEDIFTPITKTGIQEYDEYVQATMLENTCEALKILTQYGCEHIKSPSHQVFINSRRNPFDYEKELPESKDMLAVIRDTIKENVNCMSQRESNYFTSLKGSETLSLLASFEDGREILFDIIKRESLRVCLSGKHINQYNEIMENALVILIQEREFVLYKLLLNKIIRDAPDIVGNVSFTCVIEVLLKLQAIGAKDLLTKTVRSLDYVPTGKSLLDSKACHKAFDDLDILREQGLIEDKGAFRSTFVSSEKINPVRFKYIQIYSLFPNWLNERLDTHAAFKEIECEAQNDKYSKTSLETCIVPLSYLNTYRDTELDATHSFEYDSSEEMNLETLSLFVRLATRRSRCNVFDEGGLVLGLVLLHKWNQFARFRFAIICLIHLVFYTSYFLTVTFSYEAFGYIPGKSIFLDNPMHVIVLVVFFLSYALLTFVEIQQCWFLRKKYFHSYNWVDILLLVFTMFTFFQMYFESDCLKEFESVCALIVWLHALLKLRVFESFDIALEAFVALFRKVFQIIVFLIFVVFAFTNAFIILLRDKEDAYFRENMTSSMNETAKYSNDATNDFNNVFKSFRDVWFFVFGIWDPVRNGQSADNDMVAVLSIAFSFIVLLLMFNVVIGFMSASIEDVLERGRQD